MVFLLGVNLPDARAVPYALTRIHGVGVATGKRLAAELGIHKHCRMGELSEAQLTALAQRLNRMTIEAELRRTVQSRIQSMIAIGAYRGRRHQAGLPVHGQRTGTNARTAKKINRRRVGTVAAPQPAQAKKGAKKGSGQSGSRGRPGGARGFATGLQRRMGRSRWTHC